MSLQIFNLWPSFQFIVQWGPGHIRTPKSYFAVSAVLWRRWMCVYPNVSETRPDYYLVADSFPVRLPRRCKYVLLTPSWSPNTGNKQFICVPVKVDKLSRQQSRWILATSQLPIVQMVRCPPFAPILCWIDRKTGWDAQNTGKIPSSLVQTPPPHQWSARDP